MAMPALCQHHAWGPWAPIYPGRSRHPPGVFAPFAYRECAICGSQEVEEDDGRGTTTTTFRQR